MQRTTRRLSADIQMLPYRVMQILSQDRQQRRWEEEMRAAFGPSRRLPPPFLPCLPAFLHNHSIPHPSTWLYTYVHFSPPPSTCTMTSIQTHICNTFFIIIIIIKWQAYTHMQYTLSYILSYTHTLILLSIVFFISFHVVI